MQIKRIIGTFTTIAFAVSAAVPGLVFGAESMTEKLKKEETQAPYQYEKNLKKGGEPTKLDQPVSEAVKEHSQGQPYKHEKGIEPVKEAEKKPLKEPVAEGIKEHSTGGKYKYEKK